MKTRYWFVLVLTLIGALNIAACDREGPLERAGEEADEAGREIEDVTRGDRE